MWNMAERLEVEYRQPKHQGSDQSNSDRKGKKKQPYDKEIRSRVDGKEESPVKQVAFD